MQSVVSTGVRFFSLLLWPNWGWVCWWSFCPCYYDRTELPVKGRACCWREGLGGRGRRGKTCPAVTFALVGCVVVLYVVQRSFLQPEHLHFECWVQDFYQHFSATSKSQNCTCSRYPPCGTAASKTEHWHPRVTSCSPRFPRFPAPWFLSNIPRYGRNRWSQ